MKNKEVLQRIKEVALSQMPDVSHSISLETIRIPSLSKRTNSKNRFSKVSLSFLMLLIFGISSYFVFFSPTDQSVYALQSDTENYGYQILTGAMFLQSESPSNDIVPLSMQLLSEESTLFEDNIDTFNQSFAVLEGLIGAKEDITFQLLESDKPQYRQMIQVQLKSLQDEDIVYRIYLRKMLRRNIQQFEGLIEFSSSNYTFSFQRLSGQERTRIRIESSENTIIIIHQTTVNDTLRFRYDIMESDNVKRTITLDVLKEDNQITARMNTTLNGKSFQITIRKGMVQSTKVMEASYRFDEDEVDKESGDLEVTTVYDEASSQYRFQYHAQIRVNASVIVKEIIENRPPRGNAPTNPGNSNRPN
jgi:hypothetical protein